MILRAFFSFPNERQFIECQFFWEFRVIAINAAVLYSVYNAFPDFEPIKEAYTQMLHAVVFHEEAHESKDLVVFDLSKREALTGEILKQAILKMTAEDHYKECKKCPLYDSCVVNKNRRMLNNALFQERLGIILQRVSLQGYCPELASYIRDLLEQASDPITLLFEPVLEADMEVFSDQNQYEDIPAFKDINERTQWFLNGIKDGGTCLLNNLRNHPNPLTQLRLFNFFCVFSLMRYMTLLEAFYCGERIRPILLDFSGVSPSFSSVARASEMSYTQIYKSINRFYAWGYARWLDEKGYSKKELLQSETPVYEERKAVSKASKEELDALWLLAKERAADLEGEEMYLTFGETMYDMLALEASSHPITYLRALGNLSGILYPPDKLHPNKRFFVSQDIIEMLLRCCVNPGEMISGMDIRRRLWDRFGIIVGGSQFEMQTLQESGMILQIDEDALDENFSSFASMLESMDFAELMADGILQIRLGGAEK